MSGKISFAKCHFRKLFKNGKLDILTKASVQYSNKLSTNWPFRHMISNSTPTWVWCLWALLLSLTWQAPPESAPMRTWRRRKSWDLAIAFSEREQAQPPPYQVFGSVCIRHRTPPNLDQGITASRHRSCYSCAGRCVWKTSAFVCGRELGWVTVPFNLHWRGPSAHCTLSRRRDQGPQRKNLITLPNNPLDNLTRQYIHNGTGNLRLLAISRDAFSS